MARITWYEILCGRQPLGAIRCASEQNGLDLHAVIIDSCIRPVVISETDHAPTFFPVLKAEFPAQPPFTELIILFRPIRKKLEVTRAFSRKLPAYADEDKVCAFALRIFGNPLTDPGPSHVLGRMDNDMGEGPALGGNAFFLKCDLGLVGGGEGDPGICGWF